MTRWNVVLTALLVAGCGGAPPLQEAARPASHETAVEGSEAADPYEERAQGATDEPVHFYQSQRELPDESETQAPSDAAPPDESERKTTAPKPDLDPPSQDGGESAAGEIPSSEPAPTGSEPPLREPSGGSAPPSGGAVGPPLPPLPPFPSPAGGGAPPALPLPKSASRALPQTIHMNPLRTTPGSRAAQPLVLEAPRRISPPDRQMFAPVAPPPPTPLRAGSAPSRIQPRIPVATEPTTDIPAASAEPEFAPAAAAPDETAAESTPGIAALAGLGADDDPVDVPAAPESSPPSDDARTITVGTKQPDPSTTPASPAVRDRRVRVFYGTDRRAVGDPREFYEWDIGWIPGILAGLVALAGAVSAFLLPQSRVWLASGAILAATLSGVMILRGPLAGDPPPSEPSPLGVEYTADRGRLSVGWCEVTIPPNHDPGEVESPSILRLEVRPDPAKHVVLERVVREERDPFFEKVRERVQQSPRKDLFLFVHGYNVSFEDAARRTAQISFDLEFDGAAMFFSWPSQDEVIKYTVDENNVAWCVSHLKEFLLDVVRRTDAKSVNLIAHSMGNRALGAAIRELEFELRRDDAIFNEVVLAAPDVDAAIFKRDIAPALRRAARHSTLYASNHDQALLISKIVHGYPRAGDSGAGLVLVDGIETIDVSRIDLSLLGHSYYGSTEPILDDLSELLGESRRPSQRTWLRSTERDGVQYWTFREDLRNRRARVSRLTR